MKTARVIALGIICFNLLVRPALAALQLTFSSLPDSVDADNQFAADVSLVDAPQLKKYYLRAALFEAGKTSYFGYTFNHLGNWNNQPSDFVNYLEINTNDQGSWSGQLKAKADLGSTYFKGGGEYQFKIGRYTEGGSLSWSDNEDSLVINYAATANPSPSTSLGVIDPSPVVSPQPPGTGLSPSPSPTPMPSKIYRIKEISLLHLSPEPVLGTQSAQPQSRPNRQLAMMLLTAGAGLVAAAAIIIMKSWRKS